MEVSLGDTLSLTWVSCGCHSLSSVTMSTVVLFHVTSTLTNVELLVQSNSPAFNLVLDISVFVSF